MQSAGTFSFRRLNAARAVGAKCRVDATVMTRRLNSSGHGDWRSLVLSPASTWATKKTCHCSSRRGCGIACHDDPVVTLVQQRALNLPCHFAKFASEPRLLHYAIAGVERHLDVKQVEQAFGQFQVLTGPERVHGHAVSLPQRLPDRAEFDDFRSCAER